MNIPLLRDAAGKIYASLGGIDKVIPVNAYIPCCPPTPTALLQGILKAMEKNIINH